MGRLFYDHATSSYYYYFDMYFIYSLFYIFLSYSGSGYTDHFSYSSFYRVRGGASSR